jgi:hypothetical protein
VLLLADENFNYHIERALRRQRPNTDVLTVQEAKLGAIEDPDLLQWAAERERVVLNTMFRHWSATHTIGLAEVWRWRA